ncbi:MAG: hypothetical protein JO340_17050 [Acidobacteriaceae bacterium]|nr:hypothetical protein [Acidobacteriaceae bacterium]
MVIALAGRRIDAPRARELRFPIRRETLVAARIRRFFEERKASALVSSAACGADLLALEIAGQLSLRRRVVLPFPPSRFRETSVEGCPGDWGPRYDRVLSTVHDVMVLGYQENDPSSYRRANQVILEEAAALARGLRQPSCAVAVWDGHSRGSDDATAQFLSVARASCFDIAEIQTLP